MPAKNKNPFAPSKSQFGLATLASLLIHIGFLAACLNAHFSPKDQIAHAAKKLPSPCMFEPIPAAKQRALSETLNRFFPFIATPGSKRKNSAFGSPIQEAAPKIFSTREKSGHSFGEDQLTLVNFDTLGPSLPSLSSSQLESHSTASHGKSFPFEAPLNLEKADILRDLDAPQIETHSTLDAIESEGPDIASSSFLLSESPIEEPFELETSRANYEREQISLDRPARLFEKAESEGLPLPMVKAMPSETQAPSPKPDQLLPHVHVSSEELMPIQKKGEFGAILSDHFRCKTTSFQLKDSPLFVFSVELTPTSLIHFKPIDQEIIFLIDRSHSIEKTSFNTFKRAVSHALGLLPKKTLFNLCLFDKNATFFEENSLPADRGNLIRAKTFLIGQDHGGIFASTDLFKALSNLQPTVGRDGVSTAVLLTDGDTFLTSAEQKSQMRHLVRSCGQNLSLYTVATGTTNNLELLDEIAGLSRGHLTYEPTGSRLQQRFASLVRSLSLPIVKDVKLTAQKEEGREVVFLTPTERLPVMHARTPYTIVGYTNKPGDVTLFVQGNGKNGPMTIKKTISVTANHTAPNEILSKIKHLDHINKIESNLVLDQLNIDK